MAAEWYCNIAGREVGPLSPHQLKAMAERGQILPDDGVRRGADGPWIPAKEIGGLIPLPVAPPPVAGPPIPEIAVGGNGPIPAPPPTTVPAPPPVAVPAPPVVQPTPEAPDVASIHIVTERPGIESDLLLPRWQRQRDQQVKLIGVLLGSILVLGAIFAYYSLVGGEKHGYGELAERASEQGQRESVSKTPAARKPPPKSPETLEKLEGVISLDKPPETEQKSVAEILGMKTDKPAAPPEENSTDDMNPEQSGKQPAGATENQPDESRDKPAETPADKPVEKPAEKPPLEGKWVDASTHAAVVGFVTVQIVSAEVVPPLPAAADSAPRLIVTVKLQNGAVRDVDFQGWSRGGVARGVKLLDDAGKSLPPKALGRAPLPGQAPPITIPPGGTAREELAFEAPPPKTKYLLIELPAAALRRRGHGADEDPGGDDFRSVAKAAVPRTATRHARRRFRHPRGGRERKLIPVVSLLDLAPGEYTRGEVGSAAGDGQARCVLQHVQVAVEVDFTVSLPGQDAATRLGPQPEE